MDDLTWWTSIGGDLVDASGVPDEVWDAALETALDPASVVSEDLIPTDEDFLGVINSDVSWNGDDIPNIGDELPEVVPADEPGFDDDADDGFVDL